jgi:hypothetical protein
LTADVHDASGEPHEQADEREHTHQTKFFADHREQEIGVRFG